MLFFLLFSSVAADFVALLRSGQMPEIKRVVDIANSVELQNIASVIMRLFRNDSNLIISLLQTTESRLNQALLEEALTLEDYDIANTAVLYGATLSDLPIPLNNPEILSRLEQYECPVCFQVIDETRMDVCSNGHRHCGSCRYRGPRCCWTCRVNNFGLFNRRPRYGQALIYDSTALTFTSR
jgi:hypothetical protein